MKILQMGLPLTRGTKGEDLLRYYSAAQECDATPRNFGGCHEKLLPGS